MSDLERLDDILFPEVPREGFVVDTAEKAEWAVQKKARAEKNIEDAQALLNKWKERILEEFAIREKRLEEMIKPDVSDMIFFENLIRPWAELEIAKRGKKKSMKLFGGTIGFDTSQGRLEVNDEEKAVAWCENRALEEWQECVHVKKTIRKDEIKKLIKETGEVPDGVELVAGEVKFYVDTTEARKALK